MSVATGLVQRSTDELVHRLSVVQHLRRDFAAANGELVALLIWGRQPPRPGVLDERQAHVRALRFFGGLIIGGVAVSPGVSAVTVERDRCLARTSIGDQFV